MLTTTRPSDGAAVWLGPNAWQITPERAAAAGLDDLPAIMGAAAAERFFSVLAAVDPYHHRDVPAAHWYVMVVGVSPEAQGTGLGRALLQPIIDRADAAGQPCYLETAQPKNVAFSERLGFRRVVDTVEPSSGLRMWTFRRDPLAPRALDDIEAAVAAAEKAGGQVAHPPMAIPGHGTFAIYILGDIHHGLWQL